MNNVWRICKINLGETFAASGKKKDPKRARSGAGMALLFLLLGGYLLFNFYMVGTNMAALYGAEARYLMLYLAYLLSFVFTLSLSVFQMPAYLFGAKDYDFLMSMPIKQWQVVAGKITPLYITNLAYSFAFTAGLLLAYGQAEGSSAAFYVLAVAGVLLSPLVPMAIAAGLTWLLERLASLFKAQSIVRLISTVLMMLVLMGGMYFITGSGAIETEAMKRILSSVCSILVTGEFYMRALAGDFVNFLWFALITIAVFGIFIWIFSANYRHIATRRSTERSGEGYTAKDIRSYSIVETLYRKDISAFFSNTNYALNSGIGMVLLTIAAVVFLFMKNSLAQYNIPACAIAAAALSFTIMMSQIAAPSISLEAKSLWLLKSLPVRPQDIFKAKLKTCLVITLPLAEIDTLAVTIAGGCTVIEVIATALFAFALCCFVAAFGLSVGIKHAKLDWTNDITVIKQSSAVMMTTLLGMLIAFAMIGGIMTATLLANAYIIVVLGLSVILLAVSALLWRGINTRGAARFAKLYR